MAQHKHNVLDDDNQFQIDAESREITNLTGNRPALQQYDHNSETFTFIMPRLIEGHDMSQCDLVEVHYKNTSTGTSISSRATHPGIDRITDLKPNPDNDDELMFSWTPSQNATQYTGTLVFQFKFICYGNAETGEPSYIWHTGLYSFVSVNPGLNNTQDLVLEYPDIIVKLISQVDDLSTVGEDMNALQQRVGALESKVADLMYKRIEISSFSNNIGTVEIGSTVTEVAFDWALNKVPTSVILEVGSEGINQETGTTGSYVLTGQSINKDTTFNLSASDERGALAKSSTTVYFRNGVYHGVGTIEDVIGVDSLALSKTLTNTKGKTFTANAGAGQYIWYVLPSRLGECNFKVGGFDGGFTLHATAEYTNSSGYTEEYYYYRSINAELGSTTVTVS